MGMEDFFQELVRNFEIEAGELVEGASAAVLELEGGQGGEAERADRRHRDLAAMARAGFALAVARKVIDAADVAALDDD